MKIVNLNEFDDVVKEGVVLVDFYADWCGPCKMIAPILTDLAQDLDGQADIVKVNVDNDGDLAQRFDVMSIPTLILFKDGKPVGRKTGFLPKPELDKFIKSAL